MTEIALQLVLAVMLALSTAWCIVVHHRLRKLRAERTDLEGFIGDLAATVERAEAATQAIKSSSVEARSSIEEVAQKAEATRQALIDELARAERAGDRLEALLERPLPEPRTRPVAVSASKPPENDAALIAAGVRTAVRARDATARADSVSALPMDSDSGRDELKRLLASLR